MPLKKPSDQERQQLLKDAKVPPDLFDVCDCLFNMLLNEEQLLHDNADPVNHHTTVLAHMMELTKIEMEQGNLSKDNVLQAAALSILHDICPIQRITKEAIDNASPVDKPELIAERENNVRMHMSKGAEMARNAVQTLNQEYGKQVFSDESINSICSIIRIHDNPKLGIKIPKGNNMAIMLHEADRLDMLCPTGVLTDLQRKQKENSSLNPDDPREQLTQAKKNLSRFKEERELYDDNTDEPFCDSETFIRTPQAYTIYKRYLTYWNQSAVSLNK